MRLGLTLLALLFAIAGAAFGVLNSERIAFDFYFIAMTLPKGAALLCAVLLGWLLGGLVVYFGVALRLRRRIRVLARELKQRGAEATAKSVTPDA